MNNNNTTPAMKEVDVKQIKVDLSAYQYFRDNAGDKFDGNVWYKGTIDHVVALMESYAQWREENTKQDKEWVRVEVRKPEKAMQIIAGRWYNNEFLQDIIFYDGITPVAFTHWQPLLPAPPQS